MFVTSVSIYATAEPFRAQSESINKLVFINDLVHISLFGNRWSIYLCDDSTAVYNVKTDYKNC